ncbi:MAG: flagellar motor protein MotB [Dissulfurispiraceae bacterium]|jgi:chemotaxis protein MotB|nr:flagellar motor protein MotB [Dissulfurispiraceae bacterium]
MRSRRRKDEDNDNHERWLISYADFITLMFTFFVALYALSSLDQGKAQKFTSSLKQAFRVIDDPIPLHDTRSKEMLELLRGVISQTSGITVKEEPRGIVITFSDAVLFSSGSAEVKKDILPLLQKLSEQFNGVTGHFVVEGHTDNVPIASDKYPSNWELSAARAGSVVAYLVSVGMNPEKFSVAGYAEHRSLESNLTEEGRAKNRRVEIVVKNNKAI